ncbi:MAG: TonB-dependent receptor plug domain-containing protein [Flavobacteriales bacterium]|nr:TonB-dependent receptor plug domain-containing protein [Flavobacteriales bacterium]
MKTKLLFTIAIVFCVFASHSQVLKGKVADNQKLPVEYAQVFHAKSGTHVHTDSEGLFQLNNIAEGDTIKVNFFGFEEEVVVVQYPNEMLFIVLTEKVFSLEAVEVSQGIDALNLFTEIDIQTNPVNNSQEFLRKVPGLFIGQHAGGGKAEQIFLRGFDIDHGTDISIMVDDMPVNMVSHAHGQGYADLHFLIPEAVEKIDFGKGPYNAGKGNFATAGYVGFQTKDRLQESMVKLEAGQFNSSRMLGMFSLLDNQNQSAYIAADFISTDGPFESPQNFGRTNLMAKYSARLNDGGSVSVLLSHFTSQWDASGQIPQRLIDDGTISRFGAVDDTEGGKTGRSNVALNYTKNINDQSFIRNSVYYSLYNFELYSDFTFFLEDSINGDQIRQKENRNIYGAKSELNHYFKMGENTNLFQVAAGLRNDKSVDNELSHTANRETTLNNIKLGNIDETNYFGYINTEFNFGKWVINPALRYDYFLCQYNDDLITEYNSQTAEAGIISPKLNVLYNASKNLQLYLKNGRGFHSNDTRVVVPQNGKEILPAAYGSDLGFIWKPTRNIVINAAAWYLFLEQEFVYVGDAGVVEASGKTERTGVDFSWRNQLNSWLFLNADVNYTLARAAGVAEGENYIPLAPDLTATGGLSVIHPNGFYGGANFRYLKNRPANEDNSIVATGYTVVDMNTGYRFRRVDLGFSIENVLDTEWNETQFATESRLQNETESVEEIHFTPGTPFFMKANVSYRF